ncbi:phage tail sheath family protein [Mucilaginibacter jinjuensis]|uniref:Phage tail sheath C-terminal domain-containing protein n=1 Tax=Mucilaginibacter jinjuensis TaxID=1176721 RepID=A0ABY7T287_9SPHI|nr:phage tail sheath C-terminal domain-containing protein [Mucilaginibacter jinjuensis]WCT10383.1 phage tail sheath C-terminal domain-containing protein [Mucilaginibacter jinjuensis]
MAFSYKTPGVYIEEIPKFPPSVAEVETAIPVFIGYTETRGIAGAPLPVVTINTVDVTEALRITSLLEYETYFGYGVNEGVAVTITETYNTATPPVLQTRVINAAIATPSIQTMHYHMQMYFANGGGPCYIISVGDFSVSAIAAADLEAGLEMAGRYDEPTLIVFPQAIEMADATGVDTGNVYEEALLQAGTLKDRFVIMDCYGDDPSLLRGTTGTTYLNYGAAYYPQLRTALNYQYDNTDATTFTVSYSKDATVTTPAYTALSTELQSLVTLEVNKLRVTLPPSSTIAGVYALVDSTRGVWKAPANVSLNLVNGLTVQVTEAEQADLNVDSVAGKSINVIRSFTGKGILVWGARTLAGNDNEWRYISVRRFFNMVEESSKNASAAFVFEPNDSNTWVKVQGMLENFLTTLWRQGALQGAKPEQAFYVAVGLNKTMTAQDILNGLMIVEIGLAAVRPAEFIVLRFSHLLAQS